MKLLLHEDELGALLLAELEDGNACGLSEHLCDESFVDDSNVLDLALAELLLHLDLLCGELLLLVALGSCQLKVLIGNGLLLGRLDCRDLVFHLL